MLLKILTHIELLFQKQLFLTKHLRKRGISSFMLIQLFDFFLFHSSCSSSLISSAFHSVKYLDHRTSKGTESLSPKATPSAIAYVIWLEITHWRDTAAQQQLRWLICEGKGILIYFFLMYGSSLLAWMPLSCLEPCQVLLAGRDAIFLIVNCKKDVELLWWQSYCSSVLHLFIGLPVVFHRIIWLTVQTVCKILCLSSLYPCPNH